MIESNKLKRRIVGLKQNLTAVLEVHGDALADDGLNLAQPPARFEPVPDDGAYLEEKLFRR